MSQARASSLFTRAMHSSRRCHRPRRPAAAFMVMPALGCLSLTLLGLLCVPPVHAQQVAALSSDTNTGTSATATAAAPHPKRLAALRAGDVPGGARLIVTADAALDDYVAYHKGDTFCVLLPRASFAAAQRDVGGLAGLAAAPQVEQRGADVLLAFRLQPGTTARVKQTFNRLEVLFGRQQQSPDNGSTGSDQQGGAQQATPLPATAAEVPELRRQVKELETRLSELEAQLRAEPAATPAHAPAAPAGNVPAVKENDVADFFKQTKLSGFVDTYYSYNVNQPASRTNRFRTYDDKHNQFSLNEIGVTLEREPDPETARLGFRLDLRFGPAADSFHAFEPGNIETYKNILQAYGSYLAPVGSGLRLDVGKFVSPSGAEDPDTVENWNYSPGLLFAFAQPGYHAGVRATYKAHSRLELMGALINGWDNVEENNSGKSFVLGATLSPTSKLSLTQIYIGGPEQPNDQHNIRHLFDTILTYDINDRLSIMGNYDFGFDRLTDGEKVRWQGVAAYLRYAPTKRFAFSPRFEWFSDYDGFTTGTAQKLKELTFTSEYKLHTHLLTRLEFRRDWSNKLVFERGGAGRLSRHQPTVLGGFIWTFSAGAAEADAAQISATTIGAPPVATRTSPADKNKASAPKQVVPPPSAVHQQ